MCQHRIILDLKEKKKTIMVNNNDNGGGYACVETQVYQKSAYLSPLTPSSPYQGTIEGHIACGQHNSGGIIHADYSEGCSGAVWYCNTCVYITYSTL